MSARRKVYAVSRARGFSLIEVMIAVLILGFGLLGFALLQTMSVRFSQSANYRTQATNLAYDLLDQMRSNRLSAARYEGATFEAGDVAGNNCPHATGTVTVDMNIDRWQCLVVEALGEEASATVTYGGGEVEVILTWSDARADPNNPDSNTTFAVVTQL